MKSFRRSRDTSERSLSKMSLVEELGIQFGSWQLSLATVNGRKLLFGAFEMFKMSMSWEA